MCTNANKLQLFKLFRVKAVRLDVVVPLMTYPPFAVNNSAYYQHFRCCGVLKTITEDHDGLH